MLKIGSRPLSIPGLALAALIVLLNAPQAVAGSHATWVLEQSTGNVQLVKTGISPIALTRGDSFEGGDWIETGPDGRAVLRRGDDTIVVAPNSRIGLPRADTGRFATRIIQTLGTIMLTVEKKAKQHFEVQTPYLAAVVKGTTFTVGIQGDRSVVHVVEGLVEVLDFASGETGFVRPGETAMVLSDSGNGVDIRGGGRKPGPRSKAPTKAGVERNSDEPGGTVIREALGPREIDLATATGSLIKFAQGRRATPELDPSGETTDLQTTAESETSGTTDSALSSTSSQSAELTSETELDTEATLSSTEPGLEDDEGATDPILEDDQGSIDPVLEDDQGLLDLGVEDDQGSFDLVLEDNQGSLDLGIETELDSVELSSELEPKQVFRTSPSSVSPGNKFGLLKRIK